MSKSDNSKTGAKGSKPVLKVPKFGPGESLDVVLNLNPIVGDYLRLSLGIPPKEFSDMVLHHPIGKTDLCDDDWVASTPDDVSILLQRRDSPNATEYVGRRSKWIYDKLVVEGHFVKNGDFYWYVGGEFTRAAYRKELEESYLAANPGKKRKDFDFASSIVESTDYRAIIERTLANGLFAQLAKDAEQEIPDPFRTMKGILRDTPQVAVSWAKGLTRLRLLDEMRLYGLTGPPPPTPEIPDVEAVTLPPDMTDDKSIATVTNYGNSWFTCDDEYHRRSLKKLLAKYRSKLPPDQKRWFNVEVSVGNPPKGGRSNNYPSDTADAEHSVAP